jgi:hypothetical protein
MDNELQNMQAEWITDEVAQSLSVRDMDWWQALSNLSVTLALSCVFLQTPFAGAGLLFTVAAIGWTARNHDVAGKTLAGLGFIVAVIFVICDAPLHGALSGFLLMFALLLYRRARPINQHKL